VDQIFPEFRGYAGEPQSELDVAFLLGLIYDYLPFRFVVRAINDAFPDCEGVDPITWKPVRIELEVLSRNFLSHGHPLDGCDYIVCWRDNWPGSPIPVISIQQIIEKNSLDGERFLYIPKEGSLRVQLSQLKKTDTNVFNTVNYFLTQVIPYLINKYPKIQIDDTTSRHFVLRDSAGRGFFGFYPHGKLICISVNYAIEIYGNDIANCAAIFRDNVMSLKIIRSIEQADKIGHSLDFFIEFIES
jgi:hypothetical protein